MGKALMEKYRDLFDHFSRELVNHNHLIQEMQKESIEKNQQLNQKDQQLLQKETYIERIFNSKFYRVGRFILSPLILLERMIKKDKK